MSRVLRLPRQADSVILGCQAGPGKLRRCFVKGCPTWSMPERSRRAVFERWDHGSAMVIPTLRKTSEKSIDSRGWAALPKRVGF
jgi:hypothetical protein